MSSVSLKNIYKVYGNKVVAVSNFNLEIEDKEFVVFVGPSGCGKSTTLRMIAGLEEISSGELYIDGEMMNNVQPKDRNIAMVFQNYALYPHMTVYENLAYSLKLRNVAPDEIKEKVESAAKILDITDYLDRKPSALSGGQRQRVALGRAIVRDPKVFLLDEPLSNLDAKLRTAMRSEITKLHNKLQTTFIYVTHDQVEAMTMGTRIVVMKDVFMQQVDSPQNLYDYPVNKFVAGFIGTPQMNFFDGYLSAEGALTFANAQKLQLSKEAMEKYDRKRIGSGLEVTVGIRAEDLLVDEEGSIECKVNMVEELGSESLLYCSLNLNSGESIVEKEDDLSFIIKTGARCPLKRGDIAKLSVKTDFLHLFDKKNDFSLLKNYSEYILTQVAEKSEYEERLLAAEKAKEKRENKPLNRFKAKTSAKKEEINKKIYGAKTKVKRKAEKVVYKILHKK